MARGTFLWDDELQAWAPKREVLARRAAAAPKNCSAFPCPMVIGAMQPIKSMADGQIYDDKRSYHRSLARHGCEVVGYDKNWTDYVGQPYSAKAHEADVVADIKQAIEQVASR
jgi:hypothetical protein